MKKTAYLSGGCFWSLQYKFSKLPGVLSTSVGYMGGHVVKPSYTDVLSGLSGHVETVKVIYEPSKLSYKKLLSLFMKYHDPRSWDKQGPDIGNQYRSIIFYNNKIEKIEAFKIINKDPSIVTQLLKKSRFYKAEAYHQNYIIKNKKTKCKYNKTENKSIFKKVCINKSMKSEIKGTGLYNNSKYLLGKIKGTYYCSCCGNKLYKSSDAYDSSSGWPAFSNTYDGKLINSTSVKYNNITNELTCYKCNIHLGDRFFERKGIHDCINSVCLHFK